MELGIYTATYIGKDGLAGFKAGKQYVINITKKPHECYSVIDLEEDLYIPYASEISIRQNWKFLENA